MGEDPRDRSESAERGRPPWADLDDVDGQDVTLDKSGARTINAQPADLKMSGAALIKAESANLNMSFAGTVSSKNDATVNWSNVRTVAARGTVRLQYAFSRLVTAGGYIRLNNAVAGAMLARQARVERGYVGLLVAGKAELAEDTRVLVSPRGAAAVAAGVVGGLLLALTFLWSFYARGFRNRGASRARTRRGDD